MNEFNEFFQDALALGQDIPTSMEVVFAMALSFILALTISVTYRHTFRGTTYSQDYVHTLILLTVVVSVIVMVVRGNAAVAVGMFAAFSIIRFRCAVPQARDIGFIFFAMAMGMGVGARQYGVAVLTTAVICAAVYLMSKYNWFAVVRPTHSLRIRVTNDIDYDAAFAAVFERSLDQIELRSIESIQAGMMTELRYGIRLRPGISPGSLVSTLQEINGNNRVLLTTNKSESMVLESET
ncbi:MAG: DUF4956 domain-containing protein [Chthoniobacterales bacterium]